MRAIIALGVNGKRYAACGYMNLVNVNAFNKSMSDIISSCNKTAGESINTFTAKEFSERRPFMHLSKHVFGSQ